jgi:hypothetical protein
MQNIDTGSKLMEDALHRVRPRKVALVGIDSIYFANVKVIGIRANLTKL